MVEANEIERRIKESMPDARVRVEDLTGGADHYRVGVISSAFEGISRIERHRMVYGTLQDVLGGDLHALALTTQTPEEAEP